MRRKEKNPVKAMFGEVDYSVLKNTMDENKKKNEARFGNATDANGFTRLSTNIYVTEDDGEVDIVFVSRNPKVIQGHRVEVEYTKKNKTKGYFTKIETCQKTTGEYCLLCDESKNTDTVKPAKPIAFFEVICLNGTRDKETKKIEGEPTVHFMQPNSYLFYRIGEMIDDFGEDFTTQVFTWKKVGKNQQLDPKQVMTGVGKDRMSKYSTYDINEFKGAMPDFETLYQPLTDEQIEAQYLQD
jgi:hypothetical protein